MASYTAQEKQRIIDLADAGESWEAIGRELGRSSTAVEHAAHRMRKRGEWPANPSAVRLPPDGPGRPRNRKSTTAVSVRVSPPVEAALRSVAKAADLQPGRIVTLAVQRAVAQAKRRKQPPLPNSLPRKLTTLAIAAKTSTLSVCVDADAYAELTAAQPDVSPTTLAHDAALRLLIDIGYRLADADN